MVAKILWGIILFVNALFLIDEYMDYRKEKKKLENAWKKLTKERML